MAWPMSPSIEAMPTMAEPASDPQVGEQQLCDAGERDEVDVEHPLEVGEVDAADRLDAHDPRGMHQSTDRGQRRTGPLDGGVDGLDVDHVDADADRRHVGVRDHLGGRLAVEIPDGDRPTDLRQRPDAGPSDARSSAGDDDAARHGHVRSCPVGERRSR